MHCYLLVIVIAARCDCTLAHVVDHANFDAFQLNYRFSEPPFVASFPLTMPTVQHIGGAKHLSFVRCFNISRMLSWLPLAAISGGRWKRESVAP